MSGIGRRGSVCRCQRYAPRSYSKSGLTHTETHTGKRADKNNGEDRTYLPQYTERKGSKSPENGQTERPDTLRNQQVMCSSHTTSSKKALKSQGFMFIGTQCDLWGRPDGTGHEKISRGKFPRLIFSLIPSLFERHISIGCADLIWDITLDEISALCLFIGRGPFFA